MFDKKTAEKFADAYRQVVEGKKVSRESWIPKTIQDEDVADFMGAASAAAKAGKKEFKFGDKTYKVTMKKDTVDKIQDQKEEKDDDAKTEAEVEVCEKCGKVHEGACSETVKKDEDDEEEIEEVAEPEAKGEKDFKDAHKVDDKDLPDGNKAMKKESVDELQMSKLDEATDVYDKGGIQVTRYAMGKGKLGFQFNAGNGIGKYIQVAQNDLPNLMKAVQAAMKSKV